MKRRWRNIIRTCTDGERLICPTVKGSLPALVRPGHIVQCFDMDTAIVLAVSPQRCTIETRDGTVHKIAWCDVSVVNAAPDPASGLPDGLYVGCRVLDESDPDNYLIGRCVALDAQLVQYEYHFDGKRSILVAPCAHCALVAERSPGFKVTKAAMHRAFRLQLKLGGCWEEYCRENPADAAEIIADTGPAARSVVHTKRG